MELKAFKVKTTRDVKKFLYYLKNDAKLDSTPGGDFRDYFQIIGKSPKFTQGEAKVLNKIAKKCYQTCYKKKTDISHFSLKINIKDLAYKIQEDLKTDINISE